ncbi:gamma-glutamyl peptidase 5 [Fagus crenata]
MGGKRFAVLLCAEDSDYMKKMYGGYFGVFVRMLAEEGETWDVYRVITLRLESFRRTMRSNSLMGLSSPEAAMMRMEMTFGFVSS